METVFRHAGVRRPTAVAATGNLRGVGFSANSAENRSRPDLMMMKALLSALNAAVPMSGSARTVNGRTGPTAGPMTSALTAMRTRSGGVTTRETGPRTNSTVLMRTDQRDGQAPPSFGRLLSLFCSKISLMFGTII